MRRRLIAALAGLSIVVLALYLVPRLFVTAALVRDQQQELIERSADIIAVSVDSRITYGVPIDEEAIERQLQADQLLTIDRVEGPTIEVGSRSDGRGTYETQRTLVDGSTLTIQLANEVVEDRVATGIAPIVGLATLSVLAAGLGSIFLAHRLVRPFEDLAAYASGLAAEDNPPAPRSGMAEADAIAEVLDQKLVQLEDVLRREREFSANASHQLRTPLSALRIRLEDLEQWDEAVPAVREELTEALCEVDRLAGTITDLLEFARLGGIGSWSEVDIGAAVDRSIERWEPVFSNSERRISAKERDDPIVAPTSARGLSHILDVLLENALVHGVGDVELGVSRSPDHVVVSVGDQGRLAQPAPAGKLARLATQHRSGHGIGLSLAHTIAETAGARISLASTDPTVFEIRLPLTEVPNQGLSTSDPASTVNTG